MAEKSKKVQMYFDADLLRNLDAEAEKQGMNRSELIRLACERYLSNNAAEQGLDTTVRMMRRVLADELKPQFERIAKMIGKNTKASATSMYMLLVELGQQGIDAKSVFDSAEAKAAAYLTSKE